MNDQKDLSYEKKIMEMKMLIAAIYREYKLSTVTDEKNLNLLHIFASDISICNFIFCIKPKLIIMKNDAGNIPCLDAFYTNMLKQNSNDQLGKEKSSL